MSSSRPSSGVTDVATAPSVKSEDRRVDALRIHVAHAASASSVGVLLYPTIFGLNETMRGFAADLASAGMTAVVWDPYNGEDGNHVVPEMVARAKKRDDESVVNDVRLITDHMQDELGLASIAGLGWCFGGRIGLLHASGDHRIRVLSAYNPTLWSSTPVSVNGRPMGRSDWPGQTMDEYALSGSIQGPVQVCRPEHDITQPSEYDRLIEALYAREAPTLYEYYPGSEHGFSYSPGEANENAQRLAWAMTHALFSTTLQAHEVTP